MNWRRQAEKEAFRIVPETCPKVDRALEQALEQAAVLIKEQTGELRDALIDAIKCRLEAEEEVKELKLRIENLESLLEEYSTN